MVQSVNSCEYDWRSLKSKAADWRGSKAVPRECSISKEPLMRKSVWSFAILAALATSAVAADKTDVYTDEASEIGRAHV